MDTVTIKRALVSVTDKTGVAEFCKALSEEFGVEIVSTGGTAAALAEAGVPAEAAVHVGDHPRDDIAGAQGAGLRAIWINPQGKAWEGERAPDAQVASLAELPALLARWQAG